MSSRVIPMDRLAATLGADIDQVVRAVKLAIFKGVIMDTRVDTGRLRGNWQASNGAPIVQTIDRLSPTGTESVAAASSVVKTDTIDYLTNNLPYAEVWEQRDGMVARNVARVARNVAEAASRVR